MKAFISYSTIDKDQMIITLLSNNLRNQGFQILTSLNFYNKELDFTTKGQINNSNVFFGIITGHGQEKDRVLSEWNYSKTLNIPNILLVEDNIRIKNNSTKGNYVVFNRNNPQEAIKEINNRMNTQKVSIDGANNSLWPWLVGGGAFLSIINLLSKKD